MPPNDVQRVNRIGLGVEVDDPGNAALAYLGQVEARLNSIQRMAGREFLRPPRPESEQAAPRARKAREEGDANIRALRAQQEIQRQLVQSIDQNNRRAQGQIQDTAAIVAQSEERKTRAVARGVRQRKELTQEEERALDETRYRRGQRRKRHVDELVEDDPEFAERVESGLRRKRLNERINARARAIEAEETGRLAETRRLDAIAARRRTRQGLREGLSYEEIGEEGGLSHRARRIAERLGRRQEQARIRQADEERRERQREAAQRARAAREVEQAALAEQERLRALIPPPLSFDSGPAEGQRSRQARRARDEAARAAQTQAENNEREYQRTLERERRRQRATELRQRARRELGEDDGDGPGGRRRGGPFGTVDMVGRIARNIILYQAVSTLTYGMTDLIARSFELARASDDVARALNSEAIAAQTSSDSNFRLAEAFRAQGLSRSQARQTITEALRFAEDEPYLAGDLTQAVADIGAARGERASKTPELLEQLRRRESKFYKRFVGRTVEDIYERYAEEQVAQRGGYTEDITDFSGRFKTRNQAIAQYVALMSDAEKATAVYNAVLERGAVFQGEAAQRQEDLAGRVDRLSGRMQDAGENVGLFFVQLRPLVTIMEGLANVLDRVDFTKFRGSGGQGLIVNEDLARFREEYGNSWVNRVSTIWEDVSGLGPGTRGQELSTLVQFATLQEQRRRQLLREGSLRFRRPGEEEGISYEEVLTRRARGQDASAFTEEYVEDDQQRVRRQMRERDAEEAERTRRHVAREESDRQIAEHNRLKRQAQDDLNQQTQALAKIREAREGSFRVVEEVAQQRTVDNPFVKILTDGATAAQRMRLQFGYLGDATVGYFTQLEQGRIQVQRFTEQYNALDRAIGFFNKARAEQAERDLSPELTREEQGLERVAQSMVRAATELPRLARLQRQYQGLPSIYDDPLRLAREQVSQLEMVGLTGLGLDTQGRRAVDRVVNEAIIGALGELSPGQVARDPRLRAAAYRATQGQMDELRAQVGDDLARVEIIQLERQRILEGAGRISALRGQQEAQILRGRDRSQLSREDRFALAQIGRLSDAALIRVTEGLNPREMGNELFRERNDALRREAQRQVEQEADARAALEEGLQTQKNIEALLTEIRDRVLSGDMGLAVRVTNETQARIDADALKETANGLRVREPSTDTSPWANSFGRYPRGGTRP